jgi:hypothetical protein
VRRLKLAVKSQKNTDGEWGENEMWIKDGTMFINFQKFQKKLYLSFRKALLDLLKSFTLTFKKLSLSFSKVLLKL